MDPAKSPTPSGQKSSQEAFRGLPRVDDLLQIAGGSDWGRSAPRPALRAAARRVVESMRRTVRDGGKAVPEPSRAELESMLQRALDDGREHSLGRVVNATGVVLHTGLGRAPLADEAVRAVVGASQSCALEIDRDSGERGHRDSCIRALLRELLGVEAATAVNNNAAATMLAVNTFALGKEVIISRGELVEIGGSYRMPAVVERGGAKLVEVGTTNRTRTGDYRAAIGPRTGLIMKVHTSNYRTMGFTEEASLEDLVALGREMHTPVVHDLGSGLLTKSLVPALADEPTVEESVRAAPDVTLFSGDKLLGGPQAGVIVGRTEGVEAIRKNPMFRAMRLDKLILAALEQTLRLHLEGDAANRVPAIQRLNLQYDELARRAADLARRLRDRCPSILVEEFDATSEAGSGSAPTIGLRTRCVSVAVPNVAAAALARALRLGRPAVFSRIKDGCVVFDPRSLGPGDDVLLVDAVARAI